MAFKWVLCQAVWALHFLFYSWIQCSTSPNVREVQAEVKGSVTITCNYDTHHYQNLVSSWCRQISMKDCENIGEVNEVNRHYSTGRVTISQTLGRFGVVNVTMVDLQHWDTGLYTWRIWTGESYTVIQNVLLHVVSGLPSKLQVVKFKAHDTIDMCCEYNQTQKWSKAWYKVLGQKRIQWVVHSHGNINIDYNSRALVFVNEPKGMLVMKLTQLDLWDSGFYQCRQSEGPTILNEVLLLVTIDNDISPVDEITHLGGKEATEEPRDRHGHNGVWDILRWILFLIMGLCALLFTYYKRLSAAICYVRLICVRSLRPQRR